MCLQDALQLAALQRDVGRLVTQQGQARQRVDAAQEAADIPHKQPSGSLHPLLKPVVFLQDALQLAALQRDVGRLVTQQGQARQRVDAAQEAADIPHKQPSGSLHPLLKPVVFLQDALQLAALQRDVGRLVTQQGQARQRVDAAQEAADMAQSALAAACQELASLQTAGTSGR